MVSGVTVYRPISRVMRALILIVPFVLAAVVLADIAKDRATPSSALERFGPFMLIAAIVGYTFLRQAHTITCHNAEALLEFATFLGTRSVRASEIRSVSPAFLIGGQLSLQHTGGSIALPSQFAGLHDLLEWIRQHNPSVVLKGL